MIVKLERTILLDMDGVLVDFFGQALRIHGREDLADRWPHAEWDMAKVMGLSGREFWKPLRAEGIDFWAELPWYPWADELIAICEEAGGFVIASTPSRDPVSAAGKVTCLRKRFGPSFHDYMLGPHKQLLAGSGMCLIDDNDDQVDSFLAAGGRAIRFAQPWNRDHAVASERLERVRAALFSDPARTRS